MTIALTGNTHILIHLLGLEPTELARREMVTREDLAIIRQADFAAWAVAVLGDLPQPVPMRQPCSRLLYQFIVGEAGKVVGRGLSEIEPLERVGRILLLNINLGCATNPAFALVLCPPAAAKPALQVYASAFEYFEQPSAWITDIATRPAHRLQHAERLLLDGGGLGFSRDELAYLLVHVRYLLNQCRY